ncbi:MAG: hypothetical protein M0Q22_15920, partial [Sulfuritalea sp.]|nr:hypothetical protein [Sulfuritalea sp.]
ALFLLLLAPLQTPASSFKTTDYECAQMKPVRDGIKCAVKDLGESYGETLLIFIHAKHTAPKALRDRADYLVGVTIHNFLADGGTWIKIRRYSKTGIEEERTCSRIKGTAKENCGDWMPI